MVYAQDLKSCHFGGVGSSPTPGTRIWLVGILPTFLIGKNLFFAKIKIMRKEDNLIWVDLEFSGLDFSKDRILEIAVIVTDKNLRILKIGPNIKIKTNKTILDNMDDWNLEHHKKTGLIEACLKSEIEMKEAEKIILNFLKDWTLPQTSPICGNSICQDRRMLAKDMPELEKYFHYRMIDVSTIKELYKRWYPKKKTFEKENKHSALDDIKESIEELKFYKKGIFKKDFLFF